jgi:hypothetical protein
MWGFRIISSKKLQKMQRMQQQKNEEISNLKFQVKTLSEKLAKFDRKRVNGKFCKTTI